MRIARARVKLQKDFPPFELCCEEAIAMQESYYGLEVLIDLDSVEPYPPTKVGHCGNHYTTEMRQW